MDAETAVRAPYSVRGTVAASFLAEVAATPHARLLAGISGSAGSGKSALLDEVEAQYRAADVPVHRDYVENRAGSIAGQRAVLVDDAHELSDSALSRLHALVGEQGVTLVVAYGLWPQPPALTRLVGALEQYHPPVVLCPLPREDIAACAAAALGRTPPPALVDQVAELTGGMPWLVHLLLAALRHDHRRAPFSELLSHEVMDQLGVHLGTVDRDLHELLLALTVGFDLSGQLPSTLELRPDRLDALVAQARAAGLLLSGGRLVPLVRQAVLETTPAYRLRALQRTLVDSVIAQGGPLDEFAERLALDGLKDARVARTLEFAGDSVLVSEPARAATFYQEAATAGSDGLVTAARRAQAASAVGDLDGAARIVDDLVSHENAPDLARAVDVAAAVWAQRGMLAESADIYRWLGPARIGSSAALAAVTMLGSGDREGADTMLRLPPQAAPPTLRAIAATAMARGLRDSVRSATDQALRELIRASDTMTASGSTAPVPEPPAALAAIVALHSGDLGVADSVIDAALAGGQCGPATRPHLLLLRAWIAMQKDRSDLARAAITEAMTADRPLSPRNEVLRRALEVGLARRADDVHGLALAWQNARVGVLHVPVDLFSLLPLGEFVVAGTRMRDSGQLESQLADAWRLLARLGDPPLWSIPLHWSAVQAAILAEKPGELAPHAAALVRASGQSHLASVLATAGRTWLTVLAGDFQIPAVEAAARGLASVGMTWDGSRLAGHAAPRAEERKDMARLLACARELRPGSAVPMSLDGNPGTSTPVTAGAGEPALSEREREVARLVLEGKTYEEIGEAIFISPRTVEHHVARIRRRLGVSNRSELLARLRLTFGADDGSSK
ncbi:LuxR C-terminal-related transcriptional regulator [Parafrigoribacterium mesophilum]|uniref:LuxR C-terminal-related transcriptional regulator n=1 Tax=Parafrigoribacterium mesophilum TaxID=433646 RepID=UPI0031FC9827